jgi:O-methyltransferase
MPKSKRILKAVHWSIFGNPAQRRRVRLECARIAVSLFGDFSLGDDYKTWLEDKEFRHKFKELSPISPYSEERKWTIREFARYVLDIQGSMAECGCYDGASAYFLAKENPHVPLHLFDSFEGLSEPTDKDLHSWGDHLQWEKGNLLATEEEARKTLSGFDNVVFHKGWIPARFPDVTNERFRLVHIDVDLYQPTLDSLKFFYPRMNPNGVIVLDDYGFTTCPGAYKATKQFMANKPEYVLHLPTGQGIIIKGSPYA